MSLGFNLFLHLIFVLLCVGIGYFLRFSMEEFKELDQQIARMNLPEPIPHRPQSITTAPLPNLNSNTLKNKADPDKLAELKSIIKK